MREISTSVTPAEPVRLATSLKGVPRSPADPIPQSAQGPRQHASSSSRDRLELAVEPIALVLGLDPDRPATSAASCPSAGRPGRARPVLPASPRARRAGGRARRGSAPAPPRGASAARRASCGVHQAGVTLSQERHRARRRGVRDGAHRGRHARDRCRRCAGTWAPCCPASARRSQKSKSSQPSSSRPSADVAADELPGRAAHERPGDRHVVAVAEQRRVPRRRAQEVLRSRPMRARMPYAKAAAGSACERGDAAPPVRAEAARRRHRAAGRAEPALRGSRDCAPRRGPRCAVLDQLDRALRRGLEQPAHHGRRLVRRAVVDDDDLELHADRRERALDRRGHERLLVVARDHDAQRGRGQVAHPRDRRGPDRRRPYVSLTARARRVRSGDCRGGSPTRCGLRASSCAAVAAHANGRTARCRPRPRRSPPRGASTSSGRLEVLERRCAHLLPALVIGEQPCAGNRQSRDSWRPRFARPAQGARSPTRRS